MEGTTTVWLSSVGPNHTDLLHCSNEMIEVQLNIGTQEVIRKPLKISLELQSLC